MAIALPGIVGVLLPTVEDPSPSSVSSEPEDSSDPSLDILVAVETLDDVVWDEVVVDEAVVEWLRSSLANSPSENLSNGCLFSSSLMILMILTIIVGPFVDRVWQSICFP